MAGKLGQDTVVAPGVAAGIDRKKMTTDQAIILGRHLALFEYANAFKINALKTIDLREKSVLQKVARTLEVEAAKLGYILIADIKRTNPELDKTQHVVIPDEETKQ